jgi:uncharacterized protein YaaQ
MKLVMAIIQDRDADASIKRLTERKIPVTRIATTGGFLLEGNTTLLMGVEDHLVKTVEVILRETSHRRQMFMPMAASITDAAYGLASQIEVEVGGVIMFVFDVEHFEQV